MQALKSTVGWFDERLNLTKLFASTAGHAVPANTGSWFYVFGSGTLLCFIIQVLTGILLSLGYQPTASEAYGSLQYLTFEQFLGWYMRGVHYWGSNFMVAIMSLHLLQTFLFGAFKYPREMTWVTGCVLLLCTLGMAFTGQVLRFDQDSYWGLAIGASITGRTPVLGPELVRLMLGGPIIAGQTLSRFYSMHVFLIPGLIIALIAVHLRLVLALGINEYPTPGKPVKKETYREEYDELVHKHGVAFFPGAISKDLFFAAGLIIAILVLAAVSGPKGPMGEPDPTQINTAPRPDFYFLSIFSVLALLPAYMETFLLLVAPVIGIGLLFAVPFLSNTGEKSASRRPVAVLMVILASLTVGTLAYLGTYSPWSPAMDAWSTNPTPAEYMKGRSALELRGAVVLQNKQCRNCHAIGNEGGMRGPALDGVSDRLTKDQLIRQVIQGGGNMPAYGKNLTPDETTALVAFLETLGHGHAPEPPKATTVAER